MVDTESDGDGVSSFDEAVREKGKRDNHGLLGSFVLDFDSYRSGNTTNCTLE